MKAAEEVMLCELSSLMCGVESPRLETQHRSQDPARSAFLMQSNIEAVIIGNACLHDTEQFRLSEGPHCLRFQKSLISMAIKACIQFV